jgi:hypothetical protein
LCGQRVDQGIVLRVGDVVEVLHRHHRSDRLRLSNLFRIDRAHAEVFDEPPLLQLRKCRECFTERTGLWCVETTDAQIHNVERIHSEVLEIAGYLRAERRGLRAATQLPASSRAEPTLVTTVRLSACGYSPSLISRWVTNGP